MTTYRPRPIRFIISVILFSGLVMADDANPFPGELEAYELRDGYSMAVKN